MFWKYGVVIMLNTFLGPGVGQLVLKQFKKGFAIIAIAAFLIALMSALLVSSVDPSLIPQDFASMKAFAKDLIIRNSGRLKYINYALMAVWFYSYADIAVSAAAERSRNEKEKR